MRQRRFTEERIDAGVEGVGAGSWDGRSVPEVQHQRLNVLHLEGEVRGDDGQ